MAVILKTCMEHWLSLLDCQRSAQALAQRLSPAGAFVELHGPLGAGKTTWVRALLHALGVVGKVTSPTYGLMQVYDATNLNVAHFDFYRFNDPQEWEDAGFREVFAGTGLKLVEWPQQAAGLLPLADLSLIIEPDADNSRRLVHWQAYTPIGQELLP
jgi:tRNA threonylcarbamoyladenosine biosynthesis protein TsaE